jgi:hypothetical protein
MKQLSLLEDNRTVHTENLKESKRNLLEVRNEFNKLAGYKISKQKTSVFIASLRN